MKHLLLASAFILATSVAHAGQERPAAATQSQSALAASNARSASASRATGGSSSVTLNNSVRGGGSGASAGRNTPDVLLGGVNGGNPCGLAAGAGGSGAGAGGLLTWMWEGAGCERRQTAALLANMGRADAGLEYLCDDMRVRWAMRNRGTPCTIDKERWARGEK